MMFNAHLKNILSNARNLLVIIFLVAFIGALAWNFFETVFQALYFLYSHLRYVMISIVSAVIGFKVYPYIDKASRKKMERKSISSAVQSLSPRRKEAFDRIYNRLSVMSSSENYNFHKYRSYIFALISPEKEIEKLLSEDLDYVSEWVRSSSCAHCINSYILRNPGINLNPSLEDFGFEKINEMIEVIIREARSAHRITINNFHDSNDDLHSILSKAEKTVINKPVYDENYIFYGFLVIETKTIFSIDSGTVPVFIKVTLPPPFCGIQIIGFIQYKKIAYTADNVAIIPMLNFSLALSEDEHTKFVSTASNLLKKNIGIPGFFE